MIRLELDNNGSFNFHCDTWQERIKAQIFVWNLEFQHMEAESEMSKFALERSNQSVKTKEKR